MTFLKEEAKWEEGVYQFEEDDPVVGGENGISNLPLKHLANRTKYLKDQATTSSAASSEVWTAHLDTAVDPHSQYAKKESPVLTGTPTAPTPAQFDNSKKLATMEAVQRALGNNQTAVQLAVGVTTNLTAGQAGSYIQCQGGTVKLPPTAGLSLGARFAFSVVLPTY